VDWNTPPSAGIFEIEQRLHARGYKTLVVFTPPEKTAPIPTDPAVTERWFTAAATAAGGAVDAWEILNEPNLANYNSTYLSCSTCWIKNVLAPAYTALHAAGQFVVSGGWSGNPGDTNGAVAWMIKNGLLRYSDAVGHHPYGFTAEQQIGYVRQMRSLIGSKPLWLTEWNLHGVATDPGTWLSELNKAAALVKSEVQAVFYFKLTENESQAGVSAPFNVDGSKRVPWYDGTTAAIQTLLS
jgi:hypothetical protein